MVNIYFSLLGGIVDGGRPIKNGRAGVVSGLEIVLVVGKDLGLGS